MPRNAHDSLGFSLAAEEPGGGEGRREGERQHHHARRSPATAAHVTGRIDVVAFLREPAAETAARAETLRGRIWPLPCLNASSVRAGPGQHRHHPVVALVTPRLGT